MIDDGKADGLVFSEGNISIRDTVSVLILPRGRRAKHDVQSVVGNSGDPYCSLTQGRVWRTMLQTEETKRQCGSRMP